MKLTCFFITSLLFAAAYTSKAQFVIYGLSMEDVYIDTLNQANNAWQITNNFFLPEDSNKTTPYTVIVTDSVHPYPENDTSDFFVIFEAYTEDKRFAWDLWLSYFSDIDSNEIQLEISGKTEKDSTWGGQYFFPLQNTNGQIISRGWGAGLYSANDQWSDPSDTVILRFRFISKNNPEAKQGIAIKSLESDWRVTGIENLNAQLPAIKIYPNPNKGLLQSEAFENFEQYIIYSVEGKLLQEGTLQGQRNVPINSNIPNGLYFMHLSHPSKGNGMGKFLLER